MHLHDAYCMLLMQTMHGLSLGCSENTAQQQLAFNLIILKAQIRTVLQNEESKLMQSCVVLKLTIIIMNLERELYRSFTLVHGKDA